MSVIPKITCRRCGREYSGLRSRCPYCGTSRKKSAERIPLRTSSANAGTPAAEHAAVNTKWQLLFGGILLIAVVAAVIVLITVSLNAEKNSSAAVDPTPPATVSSAAPVTTPTPTPTPTPSVTSVTITFLGSKRTEFAAKVGDEVQLSATVYPTGTDQTVTWSSKDESVAKVSDKGIVTGVGKGTTTITVECGGVKADCTVYISAK
ncbi:MAG: Ig-like domain-containing protein [Oscillospiraceae bacterium]|nr:Ig-like domain-containing protein [Oscillospiraceae bacterium]